MIWGHGETVIVNRQTGVTQDSDGNDVPVFTPETYEGVPVGPGTTVELTQGQDLLSNDIHVYFQPAISLAANAEVEVVTGEYADRYKVDGRPKQYHAPRTGTSITDAKILKVTG